MKITDSEIKIVPELQHSLETTPNQQLHIISSLFKSHLASNLSVNVPDDFLELAAAAMQHLKSCGRANVVYNLAKAIGTMREDLSDSLLSAKRMPTGLIEHCVNIFCSTRQQVCRFAYTCIICTLPRYMP